MNPAIVFPIAGVVLIVWGSLCAIFNDRASRLLKTVQSIYGQRATEMVTPRYVRFLGVCQAAGGALFIVLALSGFFPHEA